MNLGIDLEGLLDTVDVDRVTTELNTGDGIRLRDTSGPLNRISVRGGHHLNNSQSGVGNFSGIEFLPDNGGVGGGTNVNTDITFSDNECDDTQGVHTQNYCIQLDNPANGSGVSRINLGITRGQGNVKGLVESPPGAYTSVAQVAH